ncbi:hypothetical protein EWM64_g5324 [Hericium alpestre]|uniref:Uncharacterized protein n=1 Tax=Hericium alpestre TaxID=135208 RepID=A0A4Y9ZX97_9AGAM|nr:hypothetical protein EWM64_g5324 [Hericium alpestre]
MPSFSSATSDCAAACFPRSASVAASGAGATFRAAGGGWKPEEALAEAGVSVPGPSLVSAGEEVGNGGKKRRDLDNIGLGEDDEQGKDILTYVRPPMDIFKAIFADEESEDEGEEEPTGGVRMKGPQPEPQPQPEAGPSREQTETVPTHLLARADTNMNAAYEPSSSSSDVNGAAPVDLATFKPTFVPRAERDAHKAKDKDRKDRKKKDKDKGVVSFAMEEDGEDGGALHIAPRRKSEKSRDGSKKKKRRKEEMAAESAWDDMWVEKAPPEVVKALDVSGSMMPMLETGGRGVEVGPPRGRKRAVDFMED